MRLTGLSHLLVEQLAIIAALLAYLTGIVSVRPHPIPPEDPFPTQEQGRGPGTADKPIEKVVLVIIDAWRTDHLVLTDQPLMPHMYDLLTRGKAYGFVLHTATPTVTLPRIKSLVTGSIPGFMDIITNFGAGELVDDNLIQRWVDAGKRIHFYGDNTWLSLFPKQFTKYDGVTSFFVSDYTEVDRNVTRHIPNEMKSDDWDVLILHYLGLDHIGHLEGPMSSLIGPKLLEMDRVLHDIQQGLQKKEKPYLVLVCGDHGMSDAGGHGGSSHSEVTTSAMLFSNTFGKAMGGKPREVKQVDVASTLAFLTNVEVPEGNVGRPITEVVSHLDIKKRMLLHHNAAKQLLGVARGSGLSVNHDNADLLFEEATKLHKEVLEKLNKDPPDEDYKESEAKRVLKFYQECEQMASDALTSKLQSYDLPTIFSSTIIVIMVLTVSVWRMCTGALFTDNISGISIICCAGCTLLLWLLSCAATTNSHICHLLRPTPWLLTVAIIYIMVMVSQVFHARLPEPNQRNGGLENVSYFLLIGTGFHIISLLGTSLVEEEHQTLYFLTTSLHFSFILKLLIQGMRPLQMYHSKAQGKERLPYEADVDTSEGELPTSVGKKGKRESMVQKLRKSPLKIVVLLIISVTLSRLMRSWNSTGDKWKHLEDLGDGIRASGSSVLALVVLSGLVVAIFLFSQTCLPLVLVTCGCIFGRHFQWSGKSSELGIIEAQISYLVLFILFVYGLLKAGLITCKAHDSKSQKLPDVYDPEEEKISIVLKYTYATVCLLCLLLQRADNVGLISLVFLQNHIVSAVLCKLVTHGIISKKMAALAINWLAFAHFFYQGNSNSLTTIDISAGFVGVTSYRPVLHGILIATQTFGGSFLTYLSYLTHIISKDGQKERWQQPLYVWWAVRLATISLYLINVTFQRHHLFIWSVFTPKLLYEGAHLLVLCILTFFMWAVEKICTILEVSYRFE
ncbi:GPI ethanolamine phosphate transferase 2-like [Macrobrachium rosenbergii]|uniref:GPI ethanolamine phosphate transferase 2-like n=1 Tax=Macrobrachium rosenbergii TaxID=79674 RepID=UPI0034D48F87